jgi:hypothetical protein
VRLDLWEVEAVAEDVAVDAHVRHGDGDLSGMR